jgi:hypothetical protein
LALAGEWYLWFVGKYEDDPGDPVGWEELLDELQQALLECAPAWFRESENLDPDWRWAQDEDVRAHMRPLVADCGFVYKAPGGHKKRGEGKKWNFFATNFGFEVRCRPNGIGCWVMPLGMPLLLIIIVAVPVANILHRAGRSRWWTILAFVPLVNLIGLWVFAFTRWPNRATTAARL